MFSFLNKNRTKLLAIMVFLTFDLIVFGAFVRLTDSGLGCPDWPGCYGQVSPLQAAHHITLAQQLQPDGPVSWFKAWIEMLHRYIASTIGFMCILLVLTAFQKTRQNQRYTTFHRNLCIFGLVWVILQGLFGMWTVTLKLMPLVVSLHLLGGITLLLILLACQHTQIPKKETPRSTSNKHLLIALGLILLYVQIFLGGWVSSNYATLACDQFPTCTTEWFPSGSFSQGFELLRPLGLTGSGAHLPFEALISIHITHRIIALFVLLYFISIFLVIRKTENTKRWRLAIMITLTLQVLTGIGTVYFNAPLLLALAHTMFATLLCSFTFKWWISYRNT
jgi:cytochrome c oxidase assembly protein subunit 15